MVIAIIELAVVHCLVIVTTKAAVKLEHLRRMHPMPSFSRCCIAIARDFVTRPVAGMPFLSRARPLVSARWVSFAFYSNYASFQFPTDDVRGLPKRCTRLFWGFPPHVSPVTLHQCQFPKGAGDIYKRNEADASMCREMLGYQSVDRA